MAVWSNTNFSEILDIRRIDSEYFHPDYINAETAVLKKSFKKLGELGDFLIGPFGSAFHVSNYDPTSKVRYIRGKDVKPFELLDEDNVYMPMADYQRLAKYSVHEDDLLFSVVGTLGNVAIVPSGLQGIFSCKSTVFRNSKIDPYYLLAYFNSRYGKKCLLRRQRGAIQAGLNKNDLEQVPVPIFSPKQTSLIADDVKQALQAKALSKQKIEEAENLLEDYLGLNNINLSKVKSYESSFSRVVRGGRVDAEYYNPLCDLIYELPCFENSKTIGDMFSIFRGVTPRKYLEQGDYAVIKTKNVRFPEVDKLRCFDFVNDDKNLTCPQENDLIFASMGVGSLGRLSYLFEKDKFIIDSTLRLLRPKTDDYKNLAIPLLLFLKSKAGQELIYTGIIGSTGIISLPDKYLLNIRVPVLPGDLKDNITSLVIESYNLNKSSKTILDEVESHICRLIESNN